MVDSGYPNTEGYLAPFMSYGVRTHLPEYKDKPPPQGMEEHFNYRHSSLRMKVECSFGQLKKRWKILYNMPQMDKQYQMSVIVSTFTLHNFIRMHKLGIPVAQHEDSNGEAYAHMFDENRKLAMTAVRNSIAQKIWNCIQRNNRFSTAGNNNSDDLMDQD